MLIMAAVQQCVTPMQPAFPWYGTCIMTTIILTAVVFIARLFLKDRTARKLLKHIEKPKINDIL